MGNMFLEVVATAQGKRLIAQRSATEFQKEQEHRWPALNSKYITLGGKMMLGDVMKLCAISKYCISTSS